MRVILDNNLPWRMASVLRSSLPGIEVAHVSDLGASDWDAGMSSLRPGARLLIAEDMAVTL